MITRLELKTTRAVGQLRRRKALVVRALSPSSSRGVVTIEGRSFPCALGRSGRRALKREGDGASPIGTWRLIRVLYRSDRVQRPLTRLPVDVVKMVDGWCDASGDRNYNRAVRMPYPASAEHLWRDDHVYDLIVVTSHNARPRQRGCGSAIFIHLARKGFEPTAGCVAMRPGDLRQILWACGTSARLVVT